MDGARLEGENSALRARVATAENAAEHYKTENERLRAALELIATEAREDAAAWMRGVDRRALGD